MLTDKKFREDTLTYCKDTVVMQFWRVEFASWNDKFVAEAIAPVLNKVGAFTANPVIRNIIGQPKSTFNIREIMDEGKILIVNLSKGLVGEDNASILGAFLVTKIQLAAMSRSDIPKIEDRRPFYLYVDEFQNFATDSFATILSEARKYGLNLTVANQYISQMSETVRDAVFGNVGTMICFRVSADDAPILSKQFEPQFEPNDLLQMHNRNFIINMVIRGEKSPAFSASTLTLPPPQTDNSATIIENTRRNYSRSRADVEQEIAEAIQPPQNLQSKRGPQSAAQAKQWPINTQTQAVTPNKIVFKTASSTRPTPTAKPPTSNAPSITKANPATQLDDTDNTMPASAPTQQGSTEDGVVVPEKRKRTRTRRRKPAAANQEGGERTATDHGDRSDRTRAPRPRPQTTQQGSELPVINDSQRNHTPPTPEPAQKTTDETILRIR
jgi:hypothetical protein